MGVFDSLRELNTASLIFRLVLALLVGGMIGLERGRKRRPAGFRTYMLVCLGAALTMLLGQYQSHMIDTVWSAAASATGMRTDMSRFSAQVINGIGFLGAGTIIVTRQQEIKGLTTAACLWASACMGLAIGAGFYECVLLGFVLIFLCVHFLPAVEALLLERAREMSVYVEFRSLDDVGEIINCIRARQVRIHEVDIDRDRKNSDQNPSAVFLIRLPKHQSRAALLSDIAGLEHVWSITEI